LSIPDAIGKVLKKFYSNKNGMEVNMIVEQESIILEDTPVECAEPENKQLLCPECGGNAEMKEGCLFCPSCGSMCS
jgi:rubrerythrin